MDNTDKLLAILFVIFVMGFVLGVYTESIAKEQITDAKGRIFANINNNTTNKQIVDKINEECNRITWYENYCKSELFKTFITPTK